MTLRDFFLRPPKGGNEKGVKRASEMSHAPGPTILRSAFNAGATASRTGKREARDVGYPDTRNFSRGHQAAQEPGDISGETFYDVEAAHSGEPHGTVDGKRDPVPAAEKAVPVQRPSTDQDVRTDGRRT